MKSTGIILVSGDLLEAGSLAGVECLVNPVNCVGVMGKGLALRFKQKYPRNFDAYALACAAGEVKPGKMLVFATGFDTVKHVINFPTKRHWKDQSRLEDIEAGLKDLVAKVKELELKSLAIPALGCGLGGLNWSEVKPLIEQAFKELPQVRVLLFEPLSG